MFKALDLWLPAYLARPRWRPGNGVTDIMLCVCDHFEPFHDADKKEALARMALWKREWPKLVREFQDADGCGPRHTFFYPIEQYDKDILSELSEICRLSEGETEIHLHHDRDTPEGLRNKLERGKEDFVRHNLLSRDEKGNVCFGFIHGNWALDNSHPEGKGCGVTGELKILRETGCYADFTMPSAPHPTQTRIINSLYYAKDSGRPKSHDNGELVRAKESRETSQPSTLNPQLLLVQGPLGLNWERRKFGILPRIENGDLTGANPPRPDRMRLWMRLGIHVQGKPDWLFVKLHTHGAIPQNSGTLLGEPTREFHRYLMKQFKSNERFRLHYVSARELVNVLHAAEDGCGGNPGQFRNYRYRSLLKNEK